MSAPPLGLYIHLPWCERKCPYCDFNSHETSELPEDAYVDALLLDLESDAPLVEHRSIETIFIGGGTPSLFSGAAIKKLLTGVSNRVSLAPGFEATMEANPGSAEATKFAQFREAGINRLSIGVQSFSDDHLRALGRVHSSEQAHSAIEHATAAGFERINLDLMHGLPAQDICIAGNDLQAAIAHSVDHLSWYQLTIEPNTAFFKQQPTLPIEDMLADIQAGGEKKITEAGYHQYEVSAYSRPGSECRHNLNYWRFGDYLGIGAGAHAKITLSDGSVQRQNKRRQPDDYLANNADDYCAATRKLAHEDLIGEFMLNAIRLNEGFSTKLFQARTGLAPEVLEPGLSSLRERGLLVIENDWVSTTALGRNFLNDIAAQFLPE